jgi:diguanylate cyclase (GGDEF)-like protein/PAS domain S-box-containing protein
MLSLPSVSLHDDQEQHGASMPAGRDTLLTPTDTHETDTERMNGVHPNASDMRSTPRLDSLHTPETYRALLETLLDAAPVGCGFVDTALRYVHVNPAMARLNGVSCEQHIGRTVREVLPHVSRYIEPVLQQVIDSGQPVLDWRTNSLSNPGGAPVRLSSSFFPVRNAQGQLLGVGCVVIDETSRIMAEERLRAAETRYRTLIEHIPAITYTLSLNNGNWTPYVSPQIESILGYTAEEYAALTPEQRLQTFHPEDRERAAATYAIDPTSITTLRLEFRRIAKDGRVVWVRDDAVVVQDDAGTPAFWLGVITDITAEKEAVRALAAMRDQYQRIVDNANDVIVTYDRDGQLTFVNRRFCELSGYAAHEALQLTIADLVHADDLPYVEEQVNARLGGDRSEQPFEFRCVTRSGEVLYVNSNASLIEEGGTVIGVQSFLRDVTERRKAEAELRKTTEQLQAVIEAAPIAMLASDASGRITMWNPGAERMFGWQAQEVLGNPAPIIPEELADEGRAMRSANFRGEHVREVETVRQRKDGSRIAVQISAAPIFDASGEIAGGMAMYVDITARKQAEEEKRRSEERFRALVQNVSDLIAICDASGRLTYVSPAIAGILGMSVDEATGATLHRLVHPEDVPSLDDCLTRVVGTEGGSLATELRFQHHGGLWRHVDLHMTNRLNDPAITGIILNGRDITERHSFEQELARQAFYDTLTGLPNRNLFMDRLRHALARQQRSKLMAGLLFVDLDNFKVINDSLGHAAGDALLHATGQRIIASVRESDTVARLSGDEFTVLLEDIESASDATDVAQRIFQSLRRPVHLDGREAFVSASIGIALTDQEDSEPEVLLRNADAAMHSAKRAGRDRFALYTPVMHARAMQRLELETELRHALRRQEFLLHYQPEIDIATGEVIGAEALIRWNRPGHGFVNPSEFIPIAEETGLIVEIGRWTLREACRTARQWHAARSNCQQVIVSVNLSARQFQDESLSSDVVSALRDAGLPPECLALEITESAVMEDVDSAVATLRALKDLGVLVMIDDFGTGYSSLAYLKRFPVDFLKIDRTFIHEIDASPNDAAIVSAMITLSHALGIRVVAEGVETQAQLGRLRMLGCDVGQGYLFARPALPGDLSGLLAVCAD